MGNCFEVSTVMVSRSLPLFSSELLFHASKDTMSSPRLNLVLVKLLLLLFLCSSRSGTRLYDAYRTLVYVPGMQEFHLQCCSSTSSPLDFWNSRRSILASTFANCCRGVRKVLSLPV